MGPEDDGFFSGKHTDRIKEGLDMKGRALPPVVWRTCHTDSIESLPQPPEFFQGVPLHPVVDDADKQTPCFQKTGDIGKIKRLPDTVEQRLNAFFLCTVIRQNKKNLFYVAPCFFHHMPFRFLLTIFVLTFPVRPICIHHDAIIMRF
jgi:hypothetical protein